MLGAARLMGSDGEVLVANGAHFIGDDEGIHEIEMTNHHRHSHANADDQRAQVREEGGMKRTAGPARGVWYMVVREISPGTRVVSPSYSISRRRLTQPWFGRTTGASSVCSGR